MKNFVIFCVLFLAFITVAEAAENAPVTLTAQDSVTWNRTDQTMTAEGAVEVDQGDAILRCDTLTAFYQKDGDAMIVQRAVAKGHVIAKKLDRTLKASTMTAFFKQNNQGKTVLERIVARDKVILQTPKEMITADLGVYQALAQTAEMTGNVRIVQGKNILQGARATVDMKTGLSRLFSATGGHKNSGRVRGVFYPKEKKNP